MARTTEAKYLPLYDFFKKTNQKTVKLTFDQMEAILGQPLPNAAYLSRSWWKKNKPPAQHYFAWNDNGYGISEIELSQYVIFQNSIHEHETSVEPEKQDILIIREAETEDARAFIQLQEAIYSETDFMLYGKSEQKQSVQGIRKRLEEWKLARNSNLFLAILNGEYAGYLVVIGGPSPRASHRASIVIGVKQQFSNKGIASTLMYHGENWAKDVGIEKLELTVIKENVIAQKLYNKLGFELEGTRKNALRIHGNYVDEFYMGKMID
ncbi:GNAT family N-acetyltransferase [Chryseomicrobium excrementi]|nr:GNAT family N-acetyltransferase [Chryseomicrobium excrementi]